MMTFYRKSHFFKAYSIFLKLIVSFMIINPSQIKKDCVNSYIHNIKIYMNQYIPLKESLKIHQLNILIS